MTSRYIVRPKADLDLDQHADYLAAKAKALRFLTAAYETFAMLATYPDMGWHSRLKNVALRSLRVFRVTASSI